MDRRLFLTAAASIGAVIAAAGKTREYGSDHDLSHIYRRLERVIDSLQHDTHDYCGHRVQAIGYLQQARDQLQSALSCEAQH